MTMKAPEATNDDHAEALASLLLSGTSHTPSALAVIIALILVELEVIEPGSMRRVTDRLVARLAGDVVEFRQKPVPANIVEAQRAALSWLRSVSPLVPKAKKRKKAIKRTR